ncbi:MAG TPA: conjugative transposon protein TraM, partial [Agriterribacter sp.]|nr:conjugative transposon protein TraM [Agriterribacter sp.]
MQQINNVLEKVLDLQYPQRMRDKLQEQSAISKGQVFAVTTPEYNSTISLLDTSGDGPDHNSTAFFSAYNEAVDSSRQNAIEAVVHETQTLVNGAVVKMRLMNDLFINGQLVRKGNFIFGTATLNKERLEISIHSIRNENSLLPVKLDVYDMDGMRGIYTPGAITRDVAKQSSDNALQSIALSSLDPSIGAQAASAGIETAKNLLSKRIRIVRVQVKAGYKILLKDNNQQP